VKRLITILLASSFLTSCIGNASLWGQYQTPTPPGGIPFTKTSAPDLPSTNVFVEIPSTPTFSLPSSATPTALFNFVLSDTPFPSETPTATYPPNSILYYTQSGDWLPGVADRFGVSPSEITSPVTLPEKGFLNQGTLLIIPDRRDLTIEYTSALQLIPDSEVVFTATAMDFDIEAYVNNADGYLATYREYLKTTAWTSGAQAIHRLSYENSINPRLLLAVLDYESHFVHGKPENEFRIKYPLGYENYLNPGVFGQLTWAINQMNHGYYSWRAGTIRELTFLDNQTIRLDPTLNAGTIAVMNLFAHMHTLNEWLRIMDANSGFPAYYQAMFGDPWARADRIESFFPPNLSQPEMVLPFELNTTWAFTGGPHSAWGQGEGPLAALDFAPRNDKSGCTVSTKWVIAMVSGLVVRSENGAVLVDVDGDGHEQTGWNILYMHIASKDRVEAGQWVNQNDHIGHASCEGGVSTGTHTHIARKYNGEWMIADGPIPFVLSGWTVIAGDKPYLGKLVKGNKIITADVYGQAWSLITRDDDE